MLAIFCNIKTIIDDNRYFQEPIIEKRRKEERVTPVVAVATAESPAYTINRASCYMPAHMLR